jgi:hypothetical protein
MSKEIKMDKLTLVRRIESINQELLEVCNVVMDAEMGSEAYEALVAVSNAISFLENYLYPTFATDADEDIFH